ncbi:MAG: polysaccharide biosynthesis protein, partial [gamma proteobacterium symbiont of Lucinoma myriamae]|nr:polysaccharide biosynthesis protein [gamma proteobacterium symbiont of Lucinoma myriamae]
MPFNLEKLYKIKSLKLNAIANFIGIGYISLIGIAIFPLYLQYLEAEAFGLVGFFSLMQAWLNLLDMGLSPTLGRQVAYARGQIDGFNSFIKLLRSFEIIFFVMACCIIGVIFFSSGWLAEIWIKAEVLSLKIITYCIGLMGIIIGLRWFTALYKSGINGLEDQVWLNVANIILSTIKFVGALFVLMFVTSDVQHFFEYQLLVGILEVIVFSSRFYNQLPISSLDYGIRFDWMSVKAVVPFTMAIAYMTVIWIMITQVDKLILSSVLSLSEFGYFSLVAMVAGGVTLLSGPIMQAMLPRLTTLFAEDKQEEMIDLYRKASQVVAVVTLSVAFMLGLFAEPLLYSWTGDSEAAQWGAQVLSWFALGNGILALSAFQYYLQNAFGQLRLHMIGSTISAIIQVPVIYFSAIHYGALGAGIGWFSVRLVWFLWWTPIVHHKFVPGLHMNWLLQDLLPIVITAMGMSYLMHLVVEFSAGEARAFIFVKLMIAGLIVLAVTSLSSKYIRMLVLQRVL